MPTSASKVVPAPIKGVQASGSGENSTEVLHCLVLVLAPAKGVAPFKGVQASGSGENSTTLILCVVGGITSCDGYINPAGGLILSDAGHDFSVQCPHVECGKLDNWKD
jgi:hypothetical protein